MNWDDPAERGRLIERVGIDEYNRLQQEEFQRQTIETVNGHAIRRVHSGRFGTVYMVDGTNRGHATLDGAREIARSWDNPTLDSIHESDILAAILMHDVDAACAYLQGLAGIADGGVASMVFSGCGDEHAWWQQATRAEREQKIREYIRAERAYAEARK